MRSRVSPQAAGVVMRRLAAGVLLAVVLSIAWVASSLAAGSRWTTATTFRGTTSQRGMALTVTYLRKGSAGAVRLRTTVVGRCPVGRRGAIRESYDIAIQARSTWPIPANWHWETIHPGALDVRVRAAVRHGRMITGSLQATWETGVAGMPRCSTGVIRWRARKR